MDDPARRWTLIAVGMDVRHHIVPQPPLMRLSRRKVDRVDIPPQRLNLRLRNREAQLRFRLSQPNPKLPPCAKLLLVAPKPAHFRRSVATNQRVFVELVGHAMKTSRQITGDESRSEGLASFGSVKIRGSSPLNSSPREASLLLALSANVKE